MSTTFTLVIDVPNFIDRPGIPIAQIMREVVPLVEAAIPLLSGQHLDRFSQQPKASWNVAWDAD